MNYDSYVIHVASEIARLKAIPLPSVLESLITETSFLVECYHSNISAKQCAQEIIEYLL